MIRRYDEVICEKANKHSLHSLKEEVEREFKSISESFNEKIAELSLLVETNRQSIEVLPQDVDQ